ncbi:MAG TPA: acetyl-CoA carboxylase biotin carboxyl carrier protein subunit, partial [Ideonella sp.]|nr:acetyl-CoA carboxylase biotin carboxyl carrier protein subunit [Ideonella sp.]
MGSKRVEAPLAATVVQLAVAAGQAVRAGDVLVVVEAMKMEHELRADADVRVVEVAVREGEQIDAGQLLLVLEPLLSAAFAAAPSAAAGPAAPRADLVAL